MVKRVANWKRRRKRGKQKQKLHLDREKNLDEHIDDCVEKKLEGKGGDIYGNNTSFQAGLYRLHVISYWYHYMPNCKESIGNKYYIIGSQSFNNMDVA